MRCKKCGLGLSTAVSKRIGICCTCRCFILLGHYSLLSRPDCSVCLAPLFTPESITQRKCKACRTWEAKMGAAAPNVRWKCTNCSDIRHSGHMGSDYRWNGKVYEHTCAGPQAGHFACRQIYDGARKLCACGVRLWYVDTLNTGKCETCLNAEAKMGIGKDLEQEAKKGAQKPESAKWTCKGCGFGAEYGTMSSLNRNSGHCNPCLMKAGKQWAEAREAGVVEGERSGHPEFHKILDEMRAMHVKKNKDYGDASDPLHNVRAGAEFVNIPAWQGAALRMNDKMVRIKSFITNGRLENEGVEDSLIDTACYAIIALILYRESKAK